VARDPGAGSMSTVGAAVILGLLVAAMLRWKVVRPVGAIVCVLFGLVLGATPLGDWVNEALSGLGGWLAAQLRGL
jgi:hypothetical protein